MNNDSREIQNNRAGDNCAGIRGNPDADLARNEVVVDETNPPQRTALPGGTAHRPVAGGDAELQSGDGLPVVGDEDALKADWTPEIAAQSGVAARAYLAQYAKPPQYNDSAKNNRPLVAEDGKQRTYNSATSGDKLSATRGRKPGKFSWDHRQVSKNTVAYCFRLCGINPETGKRYSPIYVRYMSVSGAAVLERKDKDAIKQLVGQWYKEKIEG